MKKRHIAFYFEILIDKEFVITASDGFFGS
jgi:hypothetical protein